MGFCLSSKCSNVSSEITCSTNEITSENHGKINLQCKILFCGKSLSKVQWKSLRRRYSHDFSYSSKILQDVEYEILNDWFEMLISNGSCDLDLISIIQLFSWSSNRLIWFFLLIVYLRATPETCLSRIQARQRSAEQTIDLNYLQSLHECHEQWLIKKSSFPPVLIVDANQTKERVYIDTNTHVNNLISCWKKKIFFSSWIKLIIISINRCPRRIFLIGE